LSEDEIIKWKILQEEAWRVTIFNESLWRLKARIKWIKEGDYNPKYYYLVVN